MKELGLVQARHLVGIAEEVVALGLEHRLGRDRRTAQVRLVPVSLLVKKKDPGRGRGHDMLRRRKARPHRPRTSEHLMENNATS